jgi:hypothetical protein
MLLRLNRVTDDLRLQHVLLKDEMVYTTDTNRLFIGDGETVGGQDVATMLIDGVEAIVDAHIARGVSDIRQSNYHELKDNIVSNGDRVKSEVQLEIQNLKIIINDSVDAVKKAVSQHILQSASSEIKDSHENNNNETPDFRLTCYRGTLEYPINTAPGDKLFGISFNALHNGSYMNAANIQAHWEPTANLNSGLSSDSSLVITVHRNDGQRQQFKFDHTGTLSAPAIKTGPYTTEQRDILSPTVGTIIYNSTVNKFQGYQNTNGTTPEWVDLS